MGPPTDVPAQSRFSAHAAPAALMLGVATLTFLLAYDGGSYGEASRNTLAVGLWWVVVVAVGSTLWPLEGISRTALVVGALLAGFALQTLLSTIWAESAEKAFSEFNRASLYVGVFALAVLASTRRMLARWSDGLAIGITAVVGLALFSRCFPDLLEIEQALIQFLPLSVARLSYPLEYWNGLAILAALAGPLLLRVAAASPRRFVRAFALAPFPVLAAVIYLTSSRGGVATAVVGGIALLVLAPYARTLEALAVAVVGAGAGVACLATRSVLVNQPGPGAAREGHVAFALILASCVATTVLGYLTLRFLGPRAERAGARMGPRGRAIAAGVVAVLVAGGIVAAHPVRLFEHFKRPPPTVTSALPNTKHPIPRHLLSSGSSGRWQQWDSALDEFRSAPAVGRGAGSFEGWWAQHGSLRGYVRNAHSLYLETLGELGIVGFLLVVGAFVTGIVGGARRIFATTGEERITFAALWAGFVAYAVAAGIDWMWEMTVVSVVGIALLGLIAAGGAEAGHGTRPRPGPGSRIAARATLAVIGLAAIAAQAISLLADREVQASRSAAGRGNIAAAVKRASNARRIEPWASTPYLQLALVAEQEGDYRQAEAWISNAIHRDPVDYRLWLLSARFKTEHGEVEAATADLRRAQHLSPRAGVFEQVPVLDAGG